MAENNATPETPAMEAQPVTPVESTTTTTSTPTESTTTTTTKKGNNKTLWIILGILGFLFLCCLVTLGILYASGAAFMQNLFGTAAKLSELDNTTTTGGTQDTDTNTDEDYDFSDLFSADGNFAVAVDDVALDGSNYVITLDVKNQGDTPTTFSSLLYLSLVDESGESYSQNFFYEIPQEERLDLELEAGQTFRGRIAFLVDANPSSLTLQVRDSLFDENPTEFQIK